MYETNRENHPTVVYGPADTVNHKVTDAGETAKEKLQDGGNAVKNEAQKLFGEAKGSFESFKEKHTK